MAIGDLDDGSRFGLPPIGLPQSHLDTGASDTKRGQFPATATKASVFAWRSDFPFLHSAGPAAGFSFIINLRNNTATGGSSIDVPTWAAGVVVSWNTSIITMGAGVTKHLFSLQSVLTPTFTPSVFARSHNALSLLQCDQVTIPFYDEPLIQVTESNDAGNTNGTVLSVMNVVGFVRNV